jgi:hypothetical protein
MRPLRTAHPPAAPLRRCPALRGSQVPNLWGIEDQEAIASTMRPLMAAQGLPITKPGLSSFFINRCRAYLHLVRRPPPGGPASRAARTEAGRLHAPSRWRAGLSLKTPAPAPCVAVQVLCFSPIGESFRQRIRMFPSLVNCCTIDWFREWPDEALRSVANSYYQGGAGRRGERRPRVKAAHPQRPCWRARTRRPTCPPHPSSPSLPQTSTLAWRATSC